MLRWWWWWWCVCMVARKFLGIRSDIWSESVQVCEDMCIVILRCVDLFTFQMSMAIVNKIILNDKCLLTPLLWSDFVAAMHSYIILNTKRSFCGFDFRSYILFTFHYQNNNLISIICTRKQYRTNLSRKNNKSFLCPVT